MAPDVIHFDDRMIILEQKAFEENWKKYEAYHDHIANKNRKDKDESGT